MKTLVFIHGWSLNPAFWEGLAALLPAWPQQRIDLGFYGEAHRPEIDFGNAVLIGHSLGFPSGLRLSDRWAGFVAINSFIRFVASETKIGCTSAAALRDLKRRLAANAEETLTDFHRYIGVLPVSGTPDDAALRDGLDDLREGDLAETLPKHKHGLVLAGRNDPLVPVAASADLAACAKAELRWHDSGGHVLPQNDPHWCAQHIRAFLV